MRNIIIIMQKSMGKSKEGTKRETISKEKTIIVVMSSRTDTTRIRKSTQQSMYQRQTTSNPL